MQEEGESEKTVTVQCSSLGFECDQCSYTNESDKGLKQHQRMKHKIYQTDGANDLDIEEAEDKCPLCQNAKELPDPGSCGKWGSCGVGFSGGNCVTCHLLFKIKGVHGCEAICNSLVKNVCERCRSSFK